MLAPPACKTSSRAPEPREGRGISCARWLLPTRETSTACTRGKCTRPSAPPVHRTNNPVRIARRRQARVLAAWRCAPPPGQLARGRATTTRITPRTRQRSIEFSYHVFTNKTHTSTALQVNRTVEPGSEASGERRDRRSRPTRAHTSGVNMPSWPLPEQVDVRIFPETRTHEAAYASEQQPHRRAPPTGCAHPVASKQRPSRTPWASDHGSGTPDDASRRSRTAGAAPASHLRADNRATAEAAEARRGAVPMQRCLQWATARTVAGDRWPSG